MSNSSDIVHEKFKFKARLLCIKSINLFTLHNIKAYICNFIEGGSVVKTQY